MHWLVFIFLSKLLKYDAVVRAVDEPLINLQAENVGVIESHEVSDEVDVEHGIFIFINCCKIKFKFISKKVKFLMLQRVIRRPHNRLQGRLKFTQFSKLFIFS